MKTKNDHRKLAPGTPAYVVVHGAWRLKRKRRLSSILIHNGIEEKDPEKAYLQAKEIIRAEENQEAIDAEWYEQRRSGQTALEASLGIKPLAPNARKIPFTWDQTY